MGTHNVDDGTGGLDASIFFELDRAEVSIVRTIVSLSVYSHHLFTCRTSERVMQTVSMSTSRFLPINMSRVSAPSMLIPLSITMLTPII